MLVIVANSIDGWRMLDGNAWRHLHVALGILRHAPLSWFNFLYCRILSIGTSKACRRHPAMTTWQRASARWSPRDGVPTCRVLPLRRNLTKPRGRKAHVRAAMVAGMPFLQVVLTKQQLRSALNRQLKQPNQKGWKQQQQNSLAGRLISRRLLCPQAVHQQHMAAAIPCSVRRLAQALGHQMAAAGALPGLANSKERRRDHCRT